MFPNVSSGFVSVKLSEFWVWECPESIRNFKLFALRFINNELTFC